MADSFGERMGRALRKLQQACQPQYASLFVPLSNQPGGLFQNTYLVLLLSLHFALLSIFTREQTIQKVN